MQLNDKFKIILSASSFSNPRKDFMLVIIQPVLLQKVNVQLLPTWYAKIKWHYSVLTLMCDCCLGIQALTLENTLF